MDPRDSVTVVRHETELLFYWASASMSWFGILESNEDFLMLSQPFVQQPCELFADSDRQTSVLGS